MNQHVFYNNRIPLLFMALTLLCMGFMSSASAGENSTILQSNTGFKILHHEPFTFNIQAQDEASSVRLARAAKQEAEDTLNVSFEAFGMVFDLVLESNQQLIENLPLKQQQELNQSVKLYRGKLRDNDDSWARLTVHGNLVSGMIWDGNEMYVIDNPKEVSGILSSDVDPQAASSLIYRLSDTEAGDQSCALEAPNASALEADSYSVSDYAELVKELEANIAGQAAAVSQLDIAVIGDTQFVDRHTNPTVAVVSRINVVDGIFSEQVGVHLNLTEIKLLTDSTILTATGAFDLSLQFADFVGSASFNNPGLTHLFTGRDLDGSTIGFAWLRALCNEKFGTGLSQIRTTGVAGALTVAHELGHNFGAEHDNQEGSACASTPRGFIMNPFLDGSDTFSQCSLGLMRPQIAAAACIIDVEAPTGTDLRLILPQSTLTAEIGQDFDFQLEVRNSGQRTAFNASAFISIPDELIVQSATVNGGSCQTNNNLIQCDLDEINAESVKIINIKLQPSSSGSFVINAEISADNDNSPENNLSTATVNVNSENPPETDIAVELPQNQITIEQNHAFDFAVNVRNTGSEKATNVQVEIPLSNGLVAQTANVNGGNCSISQNLVSCNLIDIEVNSEKIIKLSLQANTSGQFFINVAMSAANDNNPANNNAQATVNVTAPPPPPPMTTDVLVSLPETQLTVPQDKAFDFAINVRNTGSEKASNVQVGIPLSNGLVAQTANVNGGNCSISQNLVSCNLSDIEGNSVKTIKLSLQANTSGQFVINVAMSASNDTNPANDNIQATVNVTAPPPPTNGDNADVLVNLPETQLTVPLGKAFDFVVDIENVGSDIAKRVIVRIPISKGMYARRVKTIIGRGQCSVGVTSVSCSLGNMDPNTSRTISVQIQANNEGEFVIDATVQSRNDSNPDNNNAQAMVTVERESVSPTPNALIEAHFDKGLDGFVYIDDAFRNTNQPAFAQGNRTRKRGFSGGGLRVVTGKGRNTPKTTLSGGWEHSFSLENAASVTLSFRYKLTQGRNFNQNEFSEALLSIDSNLMSPQQGKDYLARIQGDGRGGIKQTTGWQVVTLDLGELSAGEHSLVIGESSNKTAGRSKAAFIDIDDVVMTQTTQP